MWGPLGCLGLLLFITAMNKRIMISEILPSSSGCKFNPFKNCCNPFASGGFWVSLITFFGSLLHWRGWETGRNRRNDFCRPYQNTLCLLFDLGHCVSLGTLEEDCARSSHVTAAVVGITIGHLTRYSVQRRVVGRGRVVIPIITDMQCFTSVLAKVEGFVRWETANSIFNSRAICAYVHFSTGPYVQTHKYLAISEVSVSLKMSQWLHRVRLNIPKVVFKPQRCLCKKEDACKMDA